MGHSGGETAADRREGGDDRGNVVARELCGHALLTQRLIHCV